MSAQTKGRIYPPWTSVPAWSTHHNTPAGLPVPGCLGDPLSPAGPHLLPIGCPCLLVELLFPACSFSRVQQAPGDRCKEDAKCKEDQPLESPVLGTHRAQHHLWLRKRRAGFPYGIPSPPNPGLPGTSLQAGVTCKVLPAETRFSKPGPVPDLSPELLLKSLGVVCMALASVCAGPEGMG